MSLRDFLWDYPVNLKKLYISSRPFSHIIAFTLISILLFTFIFSKTSANFLNSDYQDTFVEGIVGRPDKLNPIYLTNNQADRDVQELIFNRFVEIDEQGNPIPGIARTWVLSNDLKVYTFRIKDNLFFSDGQPLTADDVVFTFDFAKEIARKYSIDTIGSAISNVNVEKISNTQVKFTLDEVNSTFLETISVFIVPKHILENTTLDSYAFEQFNTKPVGTGPFMVSKNFGDTIVLAKNPYVKSETNIANFEFRFFKDINSLELAFRSNQIDGFGVYNHNQASFVEEYERTYSIKSFSLPFRKKVIFFNTRVPKFANVSIRRGLGYLIDKKKMLSDLDIDGTISNGPLPTTSWAYISDLNYVNYNPKAAQAEFKILGYTKNQSNGLYTSSDGKILSVDITYLENESNTKLINYLVKSFENEGVLLNPFPKNYEQLTKEVLASREFELILYEVEVSVDPDQYNLWHSLKIDYPNLNVAGYKYNRVDIYLERGRQVLDKKIRLENYTNFQKAIVNDTPALFLYEPKYTYIIRKSIKGFDGTDIEIPQQRFSNISNWKY